MHFTLMQILTLLPLGVIAGIVSSSVGMASLVSYPSLLYVAGLPPVLANMTNTSSVIYGNIGAGLSSIEELKGHVKELIYATVCIFIGSICGAYLLINYSSKSFPKLVPFFILFAAFTILWPNKSHKDLDEGNDQLGPLGKVIATLALILTGAYVGYFGAAAGVIANAILSRMINGKYAIYNAVRNVSTFSGNLVAMLMFIFHSHIYWTLVIPLGLGVLIGGYLGPKIVRHVPDQIMKVIVGILAFGLAIYLFVQAYF